jgi:hypothetical protein
LQLTIRSFFSIKTARIKALAMSNWLMGLFGWMLFNRAEQRHAKAFWANRKQQVEAAQLKQEHEDDQDSLSAADGQQKDEGY